MNLWRRRASRRRLLTGRGLVRRPIGGGWRLGRNRHEQGRRYERLCAARGLRDRDGRLDGTRLSYMCPPGRAPWGAAVRGARPGTDTQIRRGLLRGALGGSSLCAAHVGRRELGHQGVL